MTTPAKEWLKELRIPSDYDFAGYRHWGFTIYRTGYGPSSDQQWQRLLETIQTGAHDGAVSVIESTKEDHIFQELWSLFRLDARSGPALAGLDMDQLRQLYNSGEGGQPMNADLNLHRIFLFADEEVLLDPAASIVKCVDADYRAEDYIPRNPRVGGQRYFGWMPMKAGSVAYFWIELGHFNMSQIAPPTIGGSHLVIWGGQM
ncbi:hypothetical protein TW65_02199 [Stemphylium lycopersici]|uniref:Uncharacterized protein n=1 Tax=Stemphylium lycopersici TaxID=183478 RepID=A0A364MRK7_STELY|nr:hypothetical protein TW65_02199 [Stemphylium lycopersici]RAR00486.1 hypothetical protein DDE83_009101 [Stemphylium lycopersici]